MEPSEFYTMVRQQADLESVEEAEDASKPVLRTLGERLSAGAVDDLTSYLPEELAAELETDSEPESFGPEEFVARVAERVDVDEELAKRVTRATTDVLAEAAPGSEYRDVRQQLPDEYGTLFQGAENAEERVS
ncbi:DUF2267 domain-containing protein [Halalkalicoccus salilacus]|uniref:DUF2267 domain-containing protein n=1 Tax=Halalkalicoccus salilacus TaxID=3117459 RepID=UPI00300F5C61